MKEEVIENFRRVRGGWTDRLKQLHSTQLLESCPFLLHIYIKEIHIYCHACMFISCLQIQLVKKRGEKLGTGLKQDLTITIEAGNNLGRFISVWSG